MLTSKKSQYPLGFFNPKDLKNPGPVAAAHKGDSDRPTPHDRVTRKHRCVASASEHASAKKEPKWDTSNATPQPQSEGDNALNPVEAARLIPHPGTREGTNCEALSA